ncbi:MAG: DUF551 domain-containing protein [Clostridia bacterium]|jgi:hypothetical protein
MEKWINVESFLPETDTKCIIYIHKRTIDVLVTDGKYIYIAFAMINKDTGKVLSWYNQESSETINVTHWTHLPELPNYDNEKI